MSKCTSLFNKASGCRYMSRSLEHCCPDECDICVTGTGADSNCLTTLTPVVFDECGINLCKVIQRNIFANPNIHSIEVRVLDVDWNMTTCDGGSHIDRLRSRPNCSRVTLSGIQVKLAVTLLDCCHSIIDSFIITETYLPTCPEDPCFDEDTNPCSLCFELYTPQGLSYRTQDPPMPTINYLGLEEQHGSCMGNNSLRQGISSQALAKVVRFDCEEGLVALGITFYFKVIYFMQYRIQHEGQVVPPKCSPLHCEKTDACRDFVDGDLLEMTLHPLMSGVSAGSGNDVTKTVTCDPGSLGSGCCHPSVLPHPTPRPVYPCTPQHHHHSSHC